ncbi:XdhC family protein [Segeticoccus rhizosphaerae]|jgi:xanthine dehydrogenase accessory factor|uniref:XdhC family protein n=1 Tax=Segeticoccus rhizosphaerae TaxID=1104777 RepID=UPI0012657C34|nr:XdhC family protein [Segeticoccus rhizosphaerae]
MREVLSELMQWWSTGENAVLGTVVGTWRSAPRQPGASMLVGPDETVVGSVSGGCVEGAVYELAREVAQRGTPELVRYGVSDDDAFAVGLTCGGILDVFVENISPETFPVLDQVAQDIDEGRPVAVATVVEHPDPGWLGRRLVIRPVPPGDDGGDDAAHPQVHRGVVVTGTLGSDRADGAVADDVAGLLANGRNELLTYGPDGQRRGEGMRVFAASYAPPPRMLVFGAIDFAAAVARVGSFLGYRVTVCDARPVFATATRFPGADEVVVEWPHRYLRAQAEAGSLDNRTVVCVLTHDPKFDVPLLQAALELPQLAYIGAMGSRRTHAELAEQLREIGVTDDQRSRISSPIGLDLGARTPEETAISIAAEIIQLRWGGSGSRLAATEGRIHHDTVP